MKTKLNVLLVFLILIMSIGMVSASEGVSTDSHVSNGNEYLANHVTDVDIVSEGDVGTFTDLDNEIQNAKNGIVTLTKDYKYDSSKDSKFRVGIQTDDIIINGNNHTIDGSNLARIFTQYSGSVTLKDIKFVNGYVANKNNGGAYLLNSGNLTVINCQFENNYAGRHGGAIGVSSNYHGNPISIKDSSFKNNSAQFNGGSIYASNLEVENSYFELNRILTRSSTDFTLIEQKGLGGAICAVDSKIRNSLFKNNRVLNSGHYQIEEGGGAITSLKVMTVDNCEFYDNTALKGGAIFGIAAFDSYLNPSNYVKIINSNFHDNVAQSGGAVCSNFNMTVDNSVFDNNTASGYGGGAINTGFRSNDNKFTNSNFTNNLAYNYGGAISSSHSHIKNCLFDHNEANHGGAIFSLSFDMEESTFKNNVGVLGNETIVVVDKLTKDTKTKISDDEIQLFDQHKIQDYSRDVLNGAPANSKYIPTGDFAGYEVFCIEQHLFYPDNTEGVMVKDLSYIANSVDRSLVGDYIRILFYLRDAYPENYSDYSLYDVQDIIWIFTDGNYLTSRDRLIRDVLRVYEEGSVQFNDTTYVLPDGTLMEYDMQIFLTPTDRQNMVLFESHPFKPTYNETVKKDTINRTVLVGEDVEFRITVTNNGNMPLEDVFVSDIQYSKGLTYKSWRNDKNGDWTYKGNGKWVLNYILERDASASLVVIFKTSVLGNLTNNVTSGYQNITLANSTNVTTTLANPQLAVQKKSNNINSRQDDEISFDIVVQNVGEYECTGVYILEQPDKDLKYDYYVDQTNSWTHSKVNGVNRWDYNHVLGVGEESTITVFFLVKTNKLGLLYNSVIVGNNQTNRTVTSTNSTNVTKTINNDTPDQPENITNKTKHKHKHHKFDKNATGNPLFALTLVLTTLGVITSRRRR
ncbi:MAG: hypothetical protein E7Z80_08715 [Methanobrevibacter thaueri]|jgi:uncharacterized repeat protein (TIGR01451 family)|nr:hypothetical protein [Methanobrevibacter thaueri]